MQQFAACLHFAWRTTSLRVSGRAARRSCLPGLHRGGGRQAGAMVLSCLVWRCELALRKLTGYQSAQRRSNYDCNLLYITNNFFQCSGTNVSSFSLLFSFLRQNLTGPKNLIVAEKVRQFNAAVQTNSWFDVVNFFCAIQLPSIHNARTFSCKNERNYILLAGRHDSISGLIDNNT